MVDLLRRSPASAEPGITSARTLSRALLELLRSEGVDRLFGNPGTTELPLMGELAHETEIGFVLALQEATAVAMADGYARATRRPSVAVLHIVAGVANGLVGLHNARASQTPIVAIVGQQDRRHLDQAPMLSGDVAAIGRSVCKETIEVHHAYDLPQVIRRAFQIAQAPPAGPVMVVTPSDVLEEELSGELPARSRIQYGGAAEASAEAATLLAAAERPAIVAGNAVAHADALEELVHVAEALGSPVYHQPLFDAISFPLTHPLYGGMLPTSNAGIAGILAKHDLVFIAGAHAFAPHMYTVRSAVPARVQIVQLGSDPRQVGRNYPVELGLVGSIKESLAAIARELAALGRPLAAQPPQSLQAPPLDSKDLALPVPLDPELAVRAFAQALPPDVILVEEAITTGVPLRPHLRLSRSDQFHHTIGGGLGWGIGAAMGVKLAKPSRPVVAVLGDGSALYSIQGLWTAAHHRIGAVYVIFNNRQYRAVKQHLSGAERDIGVDLTDPPIDFVALASSFGVHAERLSEAADLRPALEAALERDGPTLIDLPIHGV